MADKTQIHIVQEPKAQIERYYNNDGTIELF